MIKINLLPAEIRGQKIKEKTTIGPVLSNVLVMIVVLAVLTVSGMTAFFFWNKVATVSKQYDQVNAKATQLQKEYDKRATKNAEMKKSWDRMKIQEEILNALVPDDPLLWSEKMNMISNAIPSGVYITELTVEESTEMVETEHSKALRKDFELKKAKLKKDETIPEPAVVKKPVIKQTLNIKAVATGKDENERFDKMLAFERSLKGYTLTNNQGKKRQLMDNFISDIAIGTAESTTLDGMPVWAFEFKLISKPFGFSPNKQSGT